MTTEERFSLLEGRIDQIAHDPAKERPDRRDAGLKSGSTGVAAAFVLIGLIFILNVAFKIWGTGGELFAFSQFLTLVGMITVGLLFYFAFIFGFNMLFDYRKGTLASTSAASGASKENE